MNLPHGSTGWVRVGVFAHARGSLPPARPRLVS
jgi:hypothetical protein